jgi:hypothetical protein
LAPSPDLTLTLFSFWQAFIHVLFPKLDFVSSLVISACLTPTDPIISAAVIGLYLRSLTVLVIHSDVLFQRWKIRCEECTSPHSPNSHSRVRCERWIGIPLPQHRNISHNGGFAWNGFREVVGHQLVMSVDDHAFFLLVLILETPRSSDPGDRCGRRYRYGACLSLSVLRQNGFTGYLFSRLMRFAQIKGFLDRESYVAQYIALALFTVGATNSLGNDDLLAAFAAGMPVITICFFALIFACRQCNFLGRSLQPTDRRRCILFYSRSRPQLRLLYLYRSMASVRSI